MAASHSSSSFKGSCSFDDISNINGFPATVPTLSTVTSTTSFLIAPFEDLGSSVNRVQRIVLSFDSNGASNTISITDGTVTRTLANAITASGTVVADITLIGNGKTNRLFALTLATSGVGTVDHSTDLSTTLDLSSYNLKITVTNTTNAGDYFAAHYLMDSNSAL